MNAPAKSVLLFEVSGNNFVDISLPNEAVGGGTGPNYNSSPFGNGYISIYSPSGGGTINTCPPSGGGTLKYATGYMGGRDPGAQSCHYTSKEGRHNGGATYLFGDGHAKWLKGSLVSSGYSPDNESRDQDAWGIGSAAGTSARIGTVPVAATFSIK